jgi:hypothetical protein
MKTVSGVTHSRTTTQTGEALTVNPSMRITAMDGYDIDAESKITIQRYHPDMHTLTEDVVKRIGAFAEQRSTGCVFFNPAVTVFCPNPTGAFFKVIRNEQARWCRQAGSTFPRSIRRRASRWVAGGEWLNEKFARYLDRSLAFTGILFVDGVMVPPNRWPKAEPEKRVSNACERMDSSLDLI